MESTRMDTPTDLLNHRLKSYSKGKVPSTDVACQVKIETFQSNSLQSSQDALSYEHVKQEPCGSPPAEPSKADQLLEDFIVKVKVESEFIDDYSSLIKEEAPLVKIETFQSNPIQTSQNALSNEHVKHEPCDCPPAEASKAAQLLEVVLLRSFKSSHDTNCLSRNRHV
uniref:uncharacterized protein isoform X2 n=1 Tax=Myxine glutinosa TaxID=7769 RepID=UPI00358EF156